jgi:lipopolysaccharide transport protein LptA
MRKLAISVLLLGGIVAAPLMAQNASPAKNASPAAKKPDKQAPEKPDKPAPEKADKSGAHKFLGEAPGSNEPTTTEIYSDEAFFDSNKSIGIFTGHVKVTDPRFNLQSAKLTVFISKGENQGLEKAIAEGDVGVIRDKPDPNGGPPTRAVGRSDMATYIAATGDVELKGTPRVQQGENTHIATSPDTVMLINQQGQLTTHGPSRTEIRQQPKDDETKGEGKAEGKTEAKGGGKPQGKAEKKAKNETAQPSPKK